jgi:hypothetical protein
MSFPLATLIHGSLTLEPGCDTNSYGFGDISVANNAYINGTSTSTGPSTGSLIVVGGMGVQLDAYFGSNLNVLSGITNLAQTNIDTSNGPFNVSGANAVTIQVGASSNFTVTNGNLSLISSGDSVIINGGANTPNAVQIISTNVDGGVTMLSGQQGQINIVGGSGGIQESTSSGSINLIANNATGSFIVNSSSANQNLTIGVNGATDSQLLLQSAGTSENSGASLRITSSSPNGIIQIDNTGSGGMIKQLTGSGGFNLTTATGGPIDLVANAAASRFVVNSSASNQNLTIGVNGSSDSQLSLLSSGISNSIPAIRVSTSNTTGTILIDTNEGVGAGSITQLAGSGGFSTTTNNGTLSLLANGASSSFVNQTTADDQNLTIAVAGATNSRVIIDSSGTSNQAILLQTTNSGGIALASNGVVNIDSGSIGINIGVAVTAPVTIGTPDSTTTILGNLVVQGNTTSVDTDVVTIKDNIILLNNGPTGTADGGIAIGRFQYANNNSEGDVVKDVAEVTGVARGGTAYTILLSANDTQTESDYYAGWWLLITSGTGTGQVRRIKSYNQNTKVASIFTTDDQINNVLLQNITSDIDPLPYYLIEGMDFITAPDNSSQYSLFPSAWIMSVWDSVNNEYAIASSPMINPVAMPQLHNYLNLHINNLIANNVSAFSINNSTADCITSVTLTDNNTIPVQFILNPNNTSINSGIYFVMVQPTTNPNRCYAIFAMGRMNNVAACGSVVRLIGVRGTSGENLDIQWPAGQYPQLLYRPAPGVSGTTTTFTVKIITV